MPVLALKTELKCKLCAHSEREAIDALLEKRSKGETDENGERYNLARVLATFAEWGVQNPTKENITGHFKNHCQVVTQAEYEASKVEAGLDAAQTDERVRALVASIVGPDYFESPRLLTPDESLELVRALGTYELAERARKGEKLGVTVDQLLKSVDGATRRRSSDAANELMRGVGAALGGWATREVEAAAERKELGPVEHEIVDVELSDSDRERAAEELAITRDIYSEPSSDQ